MVIEGVFTGPRRGRSFNTLTTFERAVHLHRLADELHAICETQPDGWLEHAAAMERHYNACWDEHVFLVGSGT